MAHGPSVAVGTEQRQTNLPLPLVGRDYPGYPNLKNLNIEKAMSYFDHQKEALQDGNIKMHEYDENIELFPVKPDQLETPVGPFSDRNQDIKKQYYRYNLMQNKI